MAYILIVDDEPHIRLLVSALLRQQGHVVREAETGAIALDLLKLDPQVELVVTDIQLPELDGVELVQTIKNQFPHLRVVVSSIFRYRMAEAQKKGADGILNKPYSRWQLLDSIHRALVPCARVYPAPVAL
jgi:CheY-like chemotaxis protein